MYIPARIYFEWARGHEIICDHARGVREAKLQTPIYLQSYEYSSAHVPSPGLNAEWQEA